MGNLSWFLKQIRDFSAFFFLPFVYVITLLNKWFLFWFNLHFRLHFGIVFYFIWI